MPNSDRKHLTATAQFRQQTPNRNRPIQVQLPAAQANRRYTNLAKLPTKLISKLSHS